jgi:hypothetical protein
MGEHVNKHVDAEKMDFPLKQVAYSGLGDAKQFGRFSLFQALGLDYLAEVNHQGRSNLQVLRFLGSKTDILENVSTGTGDFGLHGFLAFNPLSVVFADHEEVA